MSGAACRLFDDEAAVAVVGTRDCTPYGVSCAEKLGYGLAAGGAVVVSGLARGHRLRGAAGAPCGPAASVAAVLGNGTDVIYPPENRYLYEDVAAAGALVSEYPPGTPPDGRHFPVRNRIISGLCLGSPGGGGAGAQRCAHHGGHRPGAGAGRVRRPRTH